MSTFEPPMSIEQVMPGPECTKRNAAMSSWQVRNRREQIAELSNRSQRVGGTHLIHDCRGLLRLPAKSREPRKFLQALVFGTRIARHAVGVEYNAVAAFAARELERYARAVVLRIDRLHFLIDHQLHAQCQLASRSVFDGGWPVHGRVAWIRGDGHRGAIRYAVLRPHRVDRL